MIVVEGPDGAPIPFSDGTSHDAIAGYMQARYGLSVQAPGAASPTLGALAEPQTRAPVFESASPDVAAADALKPQRLDGFDPADIAKSGGIGVVKGGLGTLGFPGDMREFAAAGSNRLSKALGYEVPQEVFSRVLRYQPIPGIGGPTSGELTEQLENVTGPLYEPKTTWGQRAQTVGEFVPGLAMPGGWGRKAAQFASGTGASLLANEATDDPYLRVLAPLVAGMMARRATSAPRSISSNASGPGASGPGASGPGTSAPGSPEDAFGDGSIFRGGGSSPSNLKVRPGETGLSFRDSLSNPYPKGDRAVFEPGRSYIEVDPSRLPPTSVIRDNVPPGHVTIQPLAVDVLKKAIRGKGEFPR